MMLMHAAWLHGHAMEIEFPDRVARQWRAGFYYALDGKPDTENWLHLAIPTPVIVDDTRLHAGSVMLRYRVSGGALVHAVHVYDGEVRILAHDGLANQPAAWAFERHDIPGQPEVKWGLGIAIGVRFPHTGGHIEVAAAGCDFLGTPHVVVQAAG